MQSIYLHVHGHVCLCVRADVCVHAPRDTAAASELTAYF